MSRPARPQTVTSACLFVGLSCGLLLFYVIGWLTSWNSLEVQDGLRGALDGVDLGAVGLTTQGAVDALRTVLTVAVVPLVAGVVFAVYAARGHRQSRTLLTVIAVLTGLAFVTTGGFIGLLPAAFAVAAVVQLWSRDARIWFDVVNGREPSVAPRPARQAPSAPAEPPPPGTTLVAPPVAQPIGPPAASRPERMPSSLRTAVVITSIGTGLAASASFLYLLVYLFAGDALLQAQLDSPMRSMVDSTDDELEEAMRVAAAVCGITLALSLAAIAALVLIARRSAAGHVVLTVMCGVTVIMGLFTLVGLPWAALAVWVIVLLRRRESRAWVGMS